MRITGIRVKNSVVAAEQHVHLHQNFYRLTTICSFADNADIFRRAFLHMGRRACAGMVDTKGLPL